MRNINKFIICSSSLLCTSVVYGQNIKNEASPIVAEEYKKVFGTEQKYNIDLKKAPNILLITSDQQSWDAINCHDNTIKTPNLDRLVKAGISFERAYTCNPVSTPTRASMITGMYPSQHGAYALGTKLMENVPTIGDYLNEIGYDTYLVGKAHFMPLAGNASFPTLEGYPVLQDLDFWRKFHGPFYGFNHIDLARNHGDEGHVGQHYALWMMEKLKSEGRDSLEWQNWFRAPFIKNIKYDDAMQGILDMYGAKYPKAQRGAWNCPEEYHLNAWIADVSKKRIDEAIERNKPFFIWSSFFDPHPPYLVPEPWDKMYNPDDMSLPVVPENDMDDMPYHYRMTQTPDNKWGQKYVEDGEEVHGFFSQLGVSNEQARKNKSLYYGMVSMMDKYIGKILDYLDEKNLTDNTIIIFTTDHGNHIGSHGLHAKGGFVFEEDVKIPFLASWKKHFPENKKSDALISIVDLAPTMLSLIGMKNLPMTMSGIDMSDVFKGKKDSLRESVIVENHFQRTKFYQKSYITNRYKIVWYMNSDEGELFDLQEDPHEYNNLWSNPDFKDLKYQLLHKAMQADMKKEICPMPRVAPA
ncbi:sulfatase [Bacteroides xylanisolvens]|uniref:sulfatase family protein n=1 Tax=Bacteroides xylanisolvens TaxID=371601 RepID=UPI0022E50F46|nr:sulfatase-like hydrolase/transferase [Bacteroides xylanisolvens]